MSNNLNELMYQLSHLQFNSHWNYFMIGIVFFFVCITALFLYGTYLLDKESEVPWRTWTVIGTLIFITFVFCMSTTLSNPFKYQTISQTSITKLNQEKTDVKTEYPYAITLRMNQCLNSDVYVLLFKNFNAAKSTSTYLNTAINSDDDDGKAIFLHPDKDTIILKCTTKKAGINKASRPIVVIKNYQKLTKTKIVNVSGASSYQLAPTNKMTFTWVDDIF